MVHLGFWATEKVCLIKTKCMGHHFETPKSDLHPPSFNGYHKTTLVPGSQYLSTPLCVPSAYGAAWVRWTSGRRWKRPDEIFFFHSGWIHWMICRYEWSSDPTWVFRAIHRGMTGITWDPLRCWCNSPDPNSIIYTENQEWMGLSFQFWISLMLSKGTKHLHHLRAFQHGSKCDQDSVSSEIRNGDNQPLDTAIRIYHEVSWGKWICDGVDQWIQSKSNYVGKVSFTTNLGFWFYLFTVSFLWVATYHP